MDIQEARSDVAAAVRQLRSDVGQMRERMTEEDRSLGKENK
jgi:hypothetical protein